MVDFINFDEQRIDDIMVNKFEVLMAEPVFYIAFPSGKKIIGNDDLMALHHQVVSQVRSNETSSSSYL